MSHEVQLARFGNRDGAHTLLAHTGVDANLLGKIVWHTDAPPNSPGVIEPFVSGYRLDDWYVVQLTRPDDAATRPGMVATTAAIVPVSELDDTDLRTLLAQLQNANVVPGSPPEVDFAPPVDPHAHPSGAQALASALLAYGRAVWIGAGMPDAIGCLWTHLSPFDRARMVFGAAFHPEGLSVPTSSSSIVVVATSTRTAGRWNDWPAITAESPIVADASRDALLGDDHGRGAALARDIDIGSASFSQWRHLTAAAELLASIDNLNHEEVRALLQLLGLLQPAPGLGERPKRAALSRLADLTPYAKFGDIRGLRGIPWSALPSGPDLAHLLTGWARTTISDPTRGDDFADAAAEIVGANAADTFHHELSTACQNAASLLVPVAAAEAVVRHDHGANVTAWLVQNASLTVIDAALADAVATAGATPGWVAGAAIRHGLPRTHAASVDVSDPVAAWSSHIRIPRRSDDADDILARRTGDTATVSAALQVSDAVLIERAGRLVASEPLLLITGDILDERFRAVWASATRCGADPWQWIAPSDAARSLLALALDGQAVDTALLDALSRTSAADISRHPDRARLWDWLPPEVAPRFKAATAATVARSLQPGDPPPEPKLQSAMLVPDVLGSVAREDAAQALSVLRVVHAAGAEHAGLVVRRGRFAPADAIALANLIVNRGWRRAAETITDLAPSRPDLRIAAKQVSPMFGLLERLRRLMGISDGASELATTDELRDALLDTAVDLYSKGPTDASLWERSGGHDADLPTAPTGRLRWGVALDAIDRGQRGVPKLNDLLDTMIADFPRNTDLALLAKILQERKKK